MPADVRPADPTDDSWRGVVESVSRRCEEHDGRVPLNDQAVRDLTRDGLAGAGLSLADDGFALTRDGELTLAVAPTARGRGLGSALLTAVPDAVRAWSFGDHPAARALARSAGWEAARTLLQMTLPGGTRIEARPLAPGLSIRPYRPDDAGAIVAINAEAFAWHPEQGAMTRTEFEGRLGQPGQGTAGLFVAEEAGRVVGFHWTKVHPDGRGEVYVIGLAGAAQGHGLGRALLIHGLADLHARTAGADVLLYVEADNTVAVALYERIGFVVSATDVHYVRRSPSGDTMRT